MARNAARCLADLDCLTLLGCCAHTSGSNIQCIRTPHPLCNAHSTRSSDTRLPACLLPFALLSLNIVSFLSSIYLYLTPPQPSIPFGTTDSRSDTRHVKPSLADQSILPIEEVPQGKLHHPLPSHPSPRHKTSTPPLSLPSPSHLPRTGYSIRHGFPRRSL